MRVIAGKFRGRKLKSPPSLRTRPTSDRLRETVFNILAPRIEGARFLDLCAGTGAVGIEALSRGAAHVTFVDQSRKMCKLIEANLEALKVHDDEIAIVTAEASECLRKRVKKAAVPFDIIFFDPPYAADYGLLLNYLGKSAASLLSKDAIVLAEHFSKNVPDERFGDLKRWRIIKQGDSSISFYETEASG
ncbi:MAG: 16S rRNA (guanine(966)-N(2))-methyltransferase RsmD [Pyrinomonadaceae bacterium]